MVSSSWDSTDKFLSQITWGDTAEYVTGLLYQVMHDNPIAFEQWAALHKWSGFGFINDPGHALLSFQKQADSDMSGYRSNCNVSYPCAYSRRDNC